MIKIHVIGLGFVGLTTAIGLASKNFKVFGIEKNLSRLKIISKKKIPFFEPFLEKYLNINLNKNFFLKKKIILSKKDNNIIFLCLGTPNKNNGSMDISQFKKFFSDFKKNYKNEKVIFVTKSTVIPGTGNSFILNFKKYKNIDFCSNPEFLREGYAWTDFFKSGKIIIGTENKSTKVIVNKIYKNFVDKKINVNIKTAEYIKYLSNTMLANLISFSNDMTILAEKMGSIDIKKSFETIKFDKRWSGSPSEMSKYLHPGLGYGGYCLPKDVEAMNFVAKKINKNNILNIINKINYKIFNYQINKIIKKSNNKRIFVLGLSFKPFSDDVRSSKSIQLIKYLKKKKIKKIFATDPRSIEKSKKELKGVVFLKKPKILKNTVYVLATAWPEYIKFLYKLKKENIIDLRYVI